MFKNTHQFFKKVYKNKISDIEIENYIETITANYNLEKLEILNFDLERFIADKVEEFLNIDEKEIDSAIEMYKSMGLELPYKKDPNIDYLYAKSNNLSLDNLTEYNDVLDIEKLCNPFKLNKTRSLKEKIEALISAASEKKSRVTGRTDERQTAEIDLSSSNAVQKIIYLNELGIIDLLRKEPCFSTSVNNLANIISAITGEKTTTIQPYLNVLINNTGNENNNPYKTQSTVSKVKNQLVNLGFTLK